MGKKMRGCVISVCLAIMMLFVGGTIPADSVNAADSMTRAEWIHNLTEVFEMTVEADNYPDNYYSDLSAADSCYRDIMVATEFGVIDVEAGKEVQPNVAVTREFAAHTLNYCLGFQREETPYTYTDAEGVGEEYRDDAQIAVDRGWFTLVDGAFLPERTVTTSEVTVMINDAKAWLNATEVDQDHDNSFTYEEGYVEVPEETVVELEEDDNVKIYDPELDIQDGSKFIVYQDGLPLAFEAKTVSRGDGVLLVSAELLDNSEAIKTIDAQGVTKGDLGSVIPAEGVEISYEEETEEIPMSRFAPMDSQMQWSMIASRISGTKKVKSIQLSKNIGGNCKVQATLSGLSVEYRINGLNDVYVAVTGDAKIVGTGSFINAGVDSITLGSVNVGGIADVKIQAKVLVTGKIEITYETGFTAGVQYTSGGFRLVKGFYKDSFTIASEIEMTAGLEASVNVDKIPLISGKIYVEIGAKTILSSKIRPGGDPSFCMSVLSYLYAEAGASVKVGAGKLSKSFSQKVVIFDAKNSPVRVVWHYENGKLTNGCSVDPGWKYFTGIESRYGMNSSGYGISDGGELVPIFTYTLDDAGNATITGYKGNSYMVAVPDEIDGHPVVAIGDSAFRENNSFSEVVVPEGVEKIGYRSFEKCGKLTKVTLPESLTSIDRDAFGECTSLTEVNIPSKLTTKSNFGSFTRCDVLKRITFNKGITTIPAHLFMDCTGLEEITIPDTVTTIGDAAFWRCINLTEINIPETVTTIGEDSFGNCGKLTKVTLPESLTSIDRDAFGKCTSLTEVNIPSKLTTKSNFGSFTECDELKRVTFNKGITTIPAHLFMDCTGLEEITIPDTVTTIGDAAFYRCINLTEINIPETITTIGEDSFGNCEKLTKVTLPESLTSIDCDAFGKCTSLTEVNIPSKLTTKSNFGSFTGCDALKKVTFNKGITMIPAHLFADCTGLEEITIPDTVETIGEGAFRRCTNLTEINIPDTVKKLEDYAFAGCVSMKKAYIPTYWTKIPRETFNGCTSLEEVNLPKALLEIGGEAFRECSALTEIVFPEKLQSIGQSAYYGCSSLKKVTFSELADGTITVGGSAFSHCEALTDVDLSESVSQIGANAFEYCTSLAKISLPDSLRSLGGYAFQYCEALSDVDLGAGLTVIPQYCFFADRSLEAIVCPQQMTKVSAHAFGNATAFKEITLNRRITEIDSTAFSYPAKLTIYGVSGTYPETFAKEQKITFVPLNCPAESIRLNKGDYRLARGDSFQLTAAVTPANSSDKMIWKSSDEGVVTVSETGMLKGVSVGTAVVTATAGSVTAQSRITVYEKVTGVSLNISSKTLSAGETFWLTATVWPKNADDQSVRWSSSDETVAKVGATGLVSAVSAGTATIEVITVDGGYRKICSVTVEGGGEPSAPPAVSPSPTPDGGSSTPKPTTGIPTLKEDSLLTITAEGNLTGIIQNQNTVQEIRQQFADADLVMKDANGKQLADSDILGTGATVSVMDGDTVKASCQVVLVGDVNGDGKVNGKDVSRLAQSLVGKAVLTESQKEAAEVLGDGALNGKDVSRLAQSLVGKGTISSQGK